MTRKDTLLPAQQHDICIYMPREWNTPDRESWNAPIHQILKAVDNHTRLYIETGDFWHEEQAQILRTYVKNLKIFIHKEEEWNK